MPLFSEQFEAAPVDRNAMRQLLFRSSASRKGAYETTKKAFRILRDFGLVQSQPGERIAWRSPEPESFAYMLYDYYLTTGVIAPDISEILSNDYVKACFFHRAGILRAIQQGNGIGWNHEKATAVRSHYFPMWLHG